MCAPVCSGVLLCARPAGPEEFPKSVEAFESVPGTQPIPWLLPWLLPPSRESE